MAFEGGKEASQEAKGSGVSGEGEMCSFLMTGGLNQLSRVQALDLLEVVEERYQRGSTVIISQVPVEVWHQVIGDSTIADAILDRLVHNAYRIEMEGESMRRQGGIEPLSLFRYLKGKCNTLKIP